MAKLLFPNDEKKNVENIKQYILISSPFTELKDVLSTKDSWDVSNQSWRPVLGLEPNSCKQAGSAADSGWVVHGL